MDTGKPLVIILSGSSSSGKTSLGRALQNVLPFTILRIEADRAFPQFRTDANIEHNELVLAFHRSIASWAQSGFNLIVDGSLPYRNTTLAHACLELFSPFNLRLVGVHCAIPILEERERIRGNRPPGWAVEQSRDINRDLKLDAIVDTSNATPDESAARLMADLGLC